ncbi:3-methyl-2-oxobutanoate dehydrogenase [Pyxidicoccus fallax]|uniref:2-oxoisovalerate dehydrogenase subunit alpha n=1 Tax=Pyxidicoccus fallax TaxID=394095 RepID=A0A848L859_9BACT|nr:thiamine pyrophosphate-dependent enzyme [Pyxidicoccus fallax]NMO15180.1 3-methyl-2-oxobutanoate dehydrogenase [Pyxidicoccus fallax]NPC83513.1 3-methyl-2-oxobutanoate dehydrogenase [Pyxidicoccus fallax]
MAAPLAKEEAEAGALSPEALVALYRAMARIRVVDERMATLQRAGRVGFYGVCTGQEAACIGSAAALRPSDWVFPALREGAAMLLRGFPLVTYLAQCFGNAGDVGRGRQMPSHQAGRSVNQVSWSSCIGNQLPQAVGAAWAAKLQREDTVVLAYLGDGATSTGDFHTALNFAGVARVPVVFVCQNNQWSISVPFRAQTATATVAEKAAAYGMPGVKVDGNDVEAVYAATAVAVARARRGEGPTLIEAETYRVGAHSSADDPSRYREAAEVERWRAKDPLVRTRARLEAAGLWDATREAALLDELSAEVAAAIHEAEATPPVQAESMFEGVYARLPWHLAEQRSELLSVLGSRAPVPRDD